VITAKTLRDLGVKPETAMNKMFGGIEASTALQTHPKGAHDLKELEAMTKAGWSAFTIFNIPMEVGDGGRKAKAIIS
jgi:hypothetical protein